MNAKALSYRAGLPARAISGICFKCVIPNAVRNLAVLEARFLTTFGMTKSDQNNKASVQNDKIIS
ncbi:hypothetical protein CJD38_13915 [Stenotrophobium rhamnosiphilum]|uniref:Uncharacterized protein n=1 Tax=Stenotrophobium rhamnosiphilum TaxID=2029166 RepID=A0A2T5MDE5_9GAMM|nr:hypothetical protein CJD38_13915 [Stenotrophobium rhamnosiphilum]